MLTQVAEGVRVHRSDLVQSHAVVVQGRDGVLLVDPGITRVEPEIHGQVPVDLVGEWVDGIHDWQAERLAARAGAGRA